MPLSKCKHCGKMIPNIFHKYHETIQCLVMRMRRGDLDVIFREELPHIKRIPELKDPAQRRLNEFATL